MKKLTEKVKELSRNVSIKGEVLVYKTLSKLKENDGAFMSEQAILVVIMVAIGLIVFGLAKTKMGEIFTEAFDKIKAIMN